MRFSTLKMSAFCLITVSSASLLFAQKKPANDGIPGPKFITEGSVAVPRTSKTVPHWTSSFTTDGVVYPYTMVGTNPATSAATTTVPTVIIPFKFVLPDGSVLDGSTKVSNVLGSPNFKSYAYTSGNTQFGDAVQRAEFWSSVASTNYHVLLGKPTVLPTQTIAVPANQVVFFVGSHSGKLEAFMSASWFSNKLLNAIKSMHVPATTLPIILTYNTFLYVHDINEFCCIAGYHGALSSRDGNGNQQVQTYAYAAWGDPGIFVNPSFQDVLALSHEISEWMNDPFVNNPTPPWQFANGAGCQANLETGDPVEVLPNAAFPVTLNGFTYHPQTEAILPWFSRETPSSAIGGAYTYPDATLVTVPSSPCS
jgi:hypothetical protein